MVTSEHLTGMQSIVNLSNYLRSRKQKHWFIKSASAMVNFFKAL